MLATATLEKTLSLVNEGYTFASIMEETGITLEDVEAVHVAWFRGTTEQLFRELQLAGVLELAAVRLRSGQGWDEGTTGDVLREIMLVYREFKLEPRSGWEELLDGGAGRLIAQAWEENAKSDHSNFLSTKQANRDGYKARRL